MGNSIETQGNPQIAEKPRQDEFHEMADLLCDYLIKNNSDFKRICEVFYEQRGHRKLGPDLPPLKYIEEFLKDPITLESSSANFVINLMIKLQNYPTKKEMIETLESLRKIQRENTVDIPNTEKRLRRTVRESRNVNEFTAIINKVTKILEKKNKISHQSNYEGQDLANIGAHPKEQIDKFYKTGALKDFTRGSAELKGESTSGEQDSTILALIIEFTKENKAYHPIADAIANYGGQNLIADATHLLFGGILSLDDGNLVDRFKDSPGTGIVWKNDHGKISYEIRLTGTSLIDVNTRSEFYVYDEKDKKLKTLENESFDKYIDNTIFTVKAKGVLEEVDLQLEHGIQYLPSYTEFQVSTYAPGLHHILDDKFDPKNIQRDINRLLDTSPSKQDLKNLIRRLERVKVINDGKEMSLRSALKSQDSSILKNSVAQPHPRDKGLSMDDPYYEIFKTTHSVLLNRYNRAQDTTYDDIDKARISSMDSIHRITYPLNHYAGKNEFDSGLQLQGINPLNYHSDYLDQAIVDFTKEPNKNDAHPIADAIKNFEPESFYNAVMAEIFENLKLNSNQVHPHKPRASIVWKKDGDKFYYEVKIQINSLLDSKTGKFYYNDEANQKIGELEPGESTGNPILTVNMKGELLKTPGLDLKNEADRPIEFLPRCDSFTVTTFAPELKYEKQVEKHHTLSTGLR